MLEENPCPWPSIAELTSEGDGRIKHQHQNNHHNDIAMADMSLSSSGQLGRFLPVPRLQGVVDPRLGYTPEEVAAWLGAESEGGVVPWEVRMMVGERWDLHGEKRLWEVWGRGRGRGGLEGEGEVEEVEEEGWDCLGEGLVGVRMARGLVGW
ncbi:hypothetical protein C8A00DRAFT_35289 [Chaetomidium leptoderma]|uniref:Uncharacterized protein n=1 Tax=Chaetomidium leptoderma TaxID=669021 RepID=A0AAN6VI80_9PEZI|nr:hypothetical protein C8A00DRAFT_35289 [Chaetomidium leptoderma]